MLKNIEKRNINLDIIRIFSLFCVICVHFFYYSEFYNENVTGPRMFIMCLFRSFFIICVPMFLILTGYLMNQKKIEKSYYKGIIKILVVYFLCSILYSLIVKYYDKNDMNIFIFLKNILSYEGTKYSWYVEMYIGLFLIIPFLNLIFNNIQDKNKTKLLLYTLIFMVGIPCILNIHRFGSFEWWKQPAINNKYLKIIPQWWNNLYPIFYYFLGAYLKKYPIKMSCKFNLIFLMLAVTVDGAFNFYRSYGNKYVFGIWNDYASFSVMLVSFLTFNLLLKISVNTNEKFEEILKIISDSCFGAYLISCCFDTAFYPILLTLVPNIKSRFIYAPIMALCIFISSLGTSMVITYISKKICKLIYSFKN